MAEDANTSFDEVRLMVGPHVIARVDIELARPDVCAYLGRTGNPGFVMPVPLELPPLDLSLPVRLLAVSADGNFDVELMLAKKENTSDRLSALLRSDQCGMDGHVDGIFHGDLVGWAGLHGQQQPSQIWMQSTGNHPLLINCFQWRMVNSNQQLPTQCGFSVAVDSLPAGWLGQSIWFTFDQAGEWRIPQDESLIVHMRTGPATDMLKKSSAFTSIDTTQYSAQLESEPEELKHYWEALEEFRVFLNGLEGEVSRRE